jgi:hypothetical protein
VKPIYESVLFKEFVSEICYLQTPLIAKIREYRSHQTVEAEFFRCSAVDGFEALCHHTYTHIKTRISPFYGTEWSLKYRVISKISCETVDFIHLDGCYNESAGLL